MTVYSRALRVRTGEAIVPPRGYGTFGEFFTRRLRPGCRPIDTSSGALVCPCDGSLVAGGELTDGASETLFEVKGRTFSARELTGGLVEWLTEAAAGGFAVIYLSPADYHRVHSPAEGTVRRVLRIPGTCWPVNRIGQALVPSAVVSNERVVFDLDCPDGPVTLVMVGALAVRGIEVTLAGAPAGPELDGPLDLEVGRGDELGVFNLGSTVVVLWQGPARLEASPRRRVELGQLMARRG